MHLWSKSECFHLIQAPENIAFTIIDVQEKLLTKTLEIDAMKRKQKLFGNLSLSINTLYTFTVNHHI